MPFLSFFYQLQVAEGKASSGERKGGGGGGRGRGVGDLIIVLIYSTPRFLCSLSPSLEMIESRHSMRLNSYSLA